MASENIKYTGLAPLVAQVDTFTPAAVDIGDTFTLTITGYDGRVAAITFTATVATAANVSAGLVAAWNASANPLCTPITAADLTGTLTLTADVAGVAFEVAGTSTGGTLTRAATTPNSGPNDWRNTANWAGYAGLPGGAATQNVFIEDATILYGLDQSAIANTLSSLKIRGSRVGTNPADGCLPVYLKIKATAINLGEYFGPGVKVEQSPILIDTGTTASTITVHESGANSDSALPAVWIKANENTTKVIVRRGIVGVGFGDAETSSLASVDVLYKDNKSSDARVYIGSGVTLPTLNLKGGVTILRSVVTTVNANAGSLQTEGSGAITTLNITAGASVISNSTGTITTVNIYGTLDTLKSSATRTITTVNLFVGGVFKRNTVLTVTNAIAFTEQVVLSAAAA
jgi:hypothetical protein